MWSSFWAIYPVYVFTETFIPEPAFQILNCKSAFWLLTFKVYYLNALVRLGNKITGLATGKNNLCSFMHFEAYSLNIHLLLLRSEVSVNAFICLHIARHSIPEHTSFMNALPLDASMTDHQHWKCFICLIKVNISIILQYSNASCECL